MLRLRLSLLVALVVLSGCHSDAPAATAATATTAASAARSDVVVIGVNGYVIPPGERGDDGRGQFQLTRRYWAALGGAGARAMHLVPVPEGDEGALLDRVDGLLVTGGPDIDPSAYGETPHESVHPLPSERQRFDFALIREALRRDMPVLGICLGSQEINVVLGGSLVQDVPTEVGHDVAHGFVDVETMRGPVHPIQFVADTPLATMYGVEGIEVNSAHHQAVERLGEGLVVAARAPDGVVEAFYAPDRTFVVGVQYHPELQEAPNGLHQPLFNAFAEASRRYAGNRAAAH